MWQNLNPGRKSWKWPRPERQCLHSSNLKHS
jgi:hypothetical protein